MEANARRRLTRDYPPSASINYSMASSQSPRNQNNSSSTMQRNPSAPNYHANLPSSISNRQRIYSSHTSSTSSLDRPSPSLGSSEFGSQGQTSSYDSSYRDSQHRSLAGKSSDEIVGTTFDGAVLSQPVDPTKASGYQKSLRRPGPPLLSHTAPDPRMLTPSLRQSATFPAGDLQSTDFSPPRSDAGQTTSKRYSDEAGGGKMRWRKKSGISGFMNSVLGSPRNVKISAPENPVHMIHVGVDSETGQYTVCTPYVSKDYSIY